MCSKRYFAWVYVEWNAWQKPHKAVEGITFTSMWRRWLMLWHFEPSCYYYWLLLLVNFCPHRTMLLKLEDSNCRIVPSITTLCWTIMQYWLLWGKRHISIIIMYSSKCFCRPPIHEVSPTHFSLYKLKRTIASSTFSDKWHSQQNSWKIKGEMEKENTEALLTNIWRKYQYNAS